VPGVGPKKPLHIDPGGKGVMLVRLQGLQDLHADASPVGDLLQPDVAKRALANEIFAEGLHNSPLILARRGTNPVKWDLIFDTTGGRLFTTGGKWSRSLISRRFFQGKREEPIRAGGHILPHSRAGVLMTG
jgi:hypothetical protein